MRKIECKVALCNHPLEVIGTPRKIDFFLYFESIFLFFFSSPALTFIQASPRTPTTILWSTSAIEL